MPYKLSPSKIGLFTDCPRCFWLAEHKVWKRPSGIFPSLPSGMDRILKNHFDKFIGKGLPPELCESRRAGSRAGATCASLSVPECKGMRLFGEGGEKELLDVWRNNFRGIRFEDRKGNVLFGAVDNILVNGKKLVVLDYKTRGFPLKEDTHTHYQLQLDLYNYLLEKNGYKTENYGFLLFYVPDEVTKTGEVVFDTTLVKMKDEPEKAEKVWKKALKLLDGDCPSKVCQWCERV